MTCRYCYHSDDEHEGEGCGYGYCLTCEVIREFLSSNKRFEFIAEGDYSWMEEQQERGPSSD